MTSDKGMPPIKLNDYLELLDASASDAARRQRGRDPDGARSNSETDGVFARCF